MYILGFVKALCRLNLDFTCGNMLTNWLHLRDL